MLWPRTRPAASREATMSEHERCQAERVFCEASWPKVHAIVRGQGYRGADAEDLTQAYFARFLERGDLAYATAWPGGLDGFLRISVRNFLSNQRDRERAKKRGGGRRLLSLDVEPDPATLAPRLVDAETPET